MDSHSMNLLNIQSRNVTGCICSNCSTTQTPLWRRGDNDELLCNACGLYYRAKGKHRQLNSKPRKLSNSTKKYNRESSSCLGTCPGNGHCNGTGGTESCTGCPAYNQRIRPNYVCANCSATATPLWRRDLQGNPICNACGLYSKMHGKPRPISARRNTIKRRVRSLDQPEYPEDIQSTLRDYSEDSDHSINSSFSKRPRLSAKLHPKVGTTVRRKETVTIFSRNPQSSTVPTPTWLDLVNDALLKKTSNSNTSQYYSESRNRHNSLSAPSPASYSGALVSPASLASPPSHASLASISYSGSSPSLSDYNSHVSRPHPDTSLSMDMIQKEICRIDELRYRYTQMLNYLDHHQN